MIRTNLIPNPSFEVDTTGWASGTFAATITRSTATASSGSACLAVEKTTAGSFSPQFATPTGTSGFPVAGGVTYTAQAKSKAASTIRTITLTLQFYDSSGASLGSSNSSATNSTAWSVVSHTATAPAGSAYARVHISTNGSAAPVNEIHYFDDVMVEASASADTYFDGDTPDGGGVTYAWTGTANQSASTATTVPNAGTASGSFDFTGAAIGAHYDAPTRTNLIINPSFEIDLTGWTASGTGFTLDRTTDQAASGTTSMRLTSTISAGTFGVAHDQVTVTPNVDYTLQAKFRGFSIARTCRVRLLWYDNTSTFIRTDTGSGTDSTTGFTTVSLTSTAPANAAYVVPQIQVSMNVLGDVHYVDAVLLEQSSTVGTYFDGDTTDDSTHVYDWTGTPGASTSTEAPASRNGTTTGTFDFTGATSGAAPNRGTATGSFDFTATAAGATGHLGTSSGAFDFTGSATGSKLSRGSSTAGFDFTGTAVGETPPNVGTSTGAYDFTGNAAGDVAHNATAVGTYDETGSSTGATPTWQPHNLIATAVSGSQIDLTWDALDYATAYDIERDGSIIAYDVATNSYSDTGLTAETLYTYRVRAVQ